MFTVLCRHAHSDWQNIAAFQFVIGKVYFDVNLKYIIVLDIKGKHNFQLFTIYTS